MAISAANTGGAWDNAKKYIESGAMQDDSGNVVRKGSDIHKAAVVGDTVGDPFKDTSSVALNPTIKFTTLFGLLAIEIAIGLNRGLDILLFVVFFAIALVFLCRSFYDMRIDAKA